MLTHFRSLSKAMVMGEWPPRTPSIHSPPPRLLCPPQALSGLCRATRILTTRLRWEEPLSLATKLDSSNQYAVHRRVFVGWLTDSSQVQYHLYAPVGPHNQNTLGYQRNVHDLFLPNDFREELQKKAAATLQTLPSMFSPRLFQHEPG